MLHWILFVAYFSWWRRERLSAECGSQAILKGLNVVSCGETGRPSQAKVVEPQTGEAVFFGRYPCRQAKWQHYALFGPPDDVWVSSGSRWRIVLHIRRSSCAIRVGSSRNDPKGSMSWTLYQSSIILTFTRNRISSVQISGKTSRMEGRGGTYYNRR